jgi:hypothetical protein
MSENGVNGRFWILETACDASCVQCNALPPAGNLKFVSVQSFRDGHDEEKSESRQTRCRSDKLHAPLMVSMNKKRGVQRAAAVASPARRGCKTFFRCRIQARKHTTVHSSGLHRIT